MNKVLIFIVALVVLAVAAATLPVVEWLTDFFAWIENNRQISWLVFSVFYIAAVVLLLPGSLLTLGAGFLFGLGYGFAIVSFSSTVGAACAFLVGRFFARDWVADKLALMPRFAALDQAIEGRGALVVFLCRLSPVFPFNLLNYAMGLTGVKFRTYVFVSWLGMMPGTLLFVYIGSIAENITGILSGQIESLPASNWLFYGGLIATLVLTIVITRISTKTLNEHLEQAQSNSNQQ
ncbi:TVP38/TMEM64 family protein [Pseudomonadales bacterium]|nr:TVP38/TMEM64 family protein [Pseudomonadales bacterium]MDB9756753.1 TVP38/TMEM64 family protein [Pseudomonadales bacterium]